MSRDERGRGGRLRIQASFGGSEARQFAGMVLRMYCRWAERAGVQLEVVEVVDGEEGGVERAVVELAGEGAIARLDGEHGFHRLVRIPPGEARRATSFVTVEVLDRDDDPETMPPVDTRNQVRTYVLHPAESVTDDRTGQRTTDAQAVLDGDLRPFVPAVCD